MSERDRELLEFYGRQRIDDQLKFYRNRRDQFDRASGQALAVSAILLGFASAAGALAGTLMRWGPLWTSLAAILPAMSTALVAYVSLYAFEQQSKIYGDAVRAIHAASRLAPGTGQPPAAAGQRPEQDATELVRRVEDALRQEQGQWGQLTSQFQIADQAKG